MEIMVCFMVYKLRSNILVRFRFQMLACVHFIVVIAMYLLDCTSVMMNIFHTDNISDDQITTVL